MELTMYLIRQFVGGEEIMTGTKSVIDSAKSGRPETVKGMIKVSIVSEIIESDDMYTSVFRKYESRMRDGYPIY